MRIETCYISSNINQTPTVVDWGKNNLVCYGAKNSILIFDPEYGSGGKIIATLMGHSKRINSLKWISGGDVNVETEIVSGSADGRVCVWTCSDVGYKPTFLNGNNSNVNIVDGSYRKSNKLELIVIGVSMDCSANIWIRQISSGEFQKRQTFHFGYNIPVGLRLYIFPKSKEVLLGFCLDDSKIYIYTEKESLNFELSAILSGHEDWVRALDFIAVDNDILMASCSQDTFIRIWRISPNKISKEGVMDSSVELQLKVTKQTYYVYVDSVLTGHESWVYSINWCQTTKQLLSASFDKTLIIWNYSAESKMWLEKIRVGEVGGNTLGFYGGLFSPCGTKILAYSYNGAFHIWKKIENSINWVSCVTVGGHFSEVVDCDWEPEGEFLISAGADQTVRIHAPFVVYNKEATWHEIGRPQIHGYDMNSITIISRYMFASSAEEKIIRVFQAPANFVENFKNLCLVENNDNGQEFYPKGACIPSLGLSNKAIYSSTNIHATSLDNENNYNEDSHFHETHMTEPPTEETLLQNTLWPEIRKLYGHGYEVFTLDASSDGKYLASACKSTKPEYAAILLWDTTTWKNIQSLTSHTLTVVQLSFSPNSEHLLSVSRDRRWSLFSKNVQGLFDLAATTDKTTAFHSRIIWTCGWSHDSRYFTTGSRDGKLVVWRRNVEKSSTTVLGKCEPASIPLEMQNESVTAVAFAPDIVGDKYLIAVGMDSGLILLYYWFETGWKEICIFSESSRHHLTVRRLVFRPVFGQAGIKKIDKNVVQLASCSSDNSVKIHTIFLK